MVNNAGFADRLKMKYRDLYIDLITSFTMFYGINSLLIFFTIYKHFFLKLEPSDASCLEDTLTPSSKSDWRPKI